MSGFVSVASIDDVPEGEGRVVDANGISVALFNVGGEFRALDNTCIHRGGPLGDGICSATMVTCPWHGWQFNLATGECAGSPSESVYTYEVRVDGDDVQVKI